VVSSVASLVHSFLFLKGYLVLTIELDFSSRIFWMVCIFVVCRLEQCVLGSVPQAPAHNPTRAESAFHCTNGMPCACDVMCRVCASEFVSPQKYTCSHHCRCKPFCTVGVDLPISDCIQLLFNYEKPRVSSAKPTCRLQTMAGQLHTCMWSILCSSSKVLSSRSFWFSKTPPRKCILLSCE